MKFCHECGYELFLGTEKFCPECGSKLNQNHDKTKNDNKDYSTSVSNTDGNVIGTGFSGSGNITGEEIGYTIQGNQFIFNISGNVPNQVLEQIQRVITMPIQVTPSSLNAGTLTRMIMK